MKEENEIFFRDLPDPVIEYEVNVLFGRNASDEHWLAVAYGNDREALMTTIQSPTYKYADRPRRIIAIHHTAQVVDWIDPDAMPLPSA